MTDAMNVNKIENPGMGVARSLHGGDTHRDALCSKWNGRGNECKTTTKKTGDLDHVLQKITGETPRTGRDFGGGPTETVEEAHPKNAFSRHKVADCGVGQMASWTYQW